jgi:hypothetical protein
MDSERLFHLYALNLAALINRDAHRSPAYRRKELIDEAMQYALDGLSVWEKVVGEKDLEDEEHA